MMWTMTTAISSSPSASASALCAPCDWISDTCKAVHDLAMKIFKSIYNCLSGRRPFIPIETAATTRSVTVLASQDIVGFYRGLGPNNNGVTLDEILGWDDNRLEALHNFIQWLFPTTQRSGPNPTAPILDQPTILIFRNDPALKNQVLRSFRRMLSFYGLQMDERTKVISRAPNFAARAPVWLPGTYHNFLRITRIITSMGLLGLPEYSRSFFNILQDINRNEGRGIIPADSFAIWQSACPS